MTTRGRTSPLGIKVSRGPRLPKGPAQPESFQDVALRAAVAERAAIVTWLRDVMGEEDLATRVQRAEHEGEP
jgi:hypothetical protein